MTNIARKIFLAVIILKMISQSNDALDELFN